MSQVVPYAVVTGREGNKSTNFLVPQMSSVICSASLLAQCLMWSPRVVCRWVMRASYHLSPGCPCGKPANVYTRGSALAWTLNPNMTPRGCSCVSTKTRIQPHDPRHSGALNSEKCLVAQDPDADIRIQPWKQSFGSRVLGTQVSNKLLVFRRKAVQRREWKRPLWFWSW